MVVTFLATFIWRRLLNSAVLAIATHRKLKKVSNETSTQVITQMINKWRIKIIYEELYKSFHEKEDWKNSRRNIVVI